jgi:hypothetical protein
MGSKMIMRTTGEPVQIPSRSARDNEIHRATEERMVKDTLILQKVNKVQREAFKTRFPGQVEHCMRLTAERLQALLTKKPSDMTNTDTWSGTPSEILALSHGLYYLSIMNQHYPIDTEEE